MATAQPVQISDVSISSAHIDRNYTETGSRNAAHGTPLGSPGKKVDSWKFALNAAKMTETPGSLTSRRGSTK